MDTYLMIDADGLVQNVATWDGVSEWDLPEGWTVEKMRRVEYYEFGQPLGIKRPEPPEPGPTTAERQTKSSIT